VLGELSGEDEAHGGLDLTGGHGGLLVVAGQLGRLFAWAANHSLAGMRDETTEGDWFFRGVVVIIITGCVCGRPRPCIRRVEEVTNGFGAYARSPRMRRAS
jgi:hypothetical protein